MQIIAMVDSQVVRAVVGRETKRCCDYAERIGRLVSIDLECEI